MARTTDKMDEEMTTMPLPKLPPPKPPEPPDPNLLTLEYLSRYDTVEVCRTKDGVGIDTVYIDEGYGPNWKPFNFYATVREHGARKFISIRIAHKTNSVSLTAPTIEHFHKAVEFLGATMPPLRSVAPSAT